MAGLDQLQALANNRFVTRKRSSLLHSLALVSWNPGQIRILGCINLEIEVLSAVPNDDLFLRSDPLKMNPQRFS